MRVSVVINPRAGAGSAARQLPALRKGLSSLGIEHEILETRGSGHATSLAIQAIERGCTLLGVVGGDGTLNEVSQAYVEADGTPRTGPPLALLPCGTGGDFPRSCDFRQDGIAGGLARLAAAKLRPLDLGVITLHDIHGGVVHRAFVNVASVGISGEVDERVERGPKWLGGKAAFLIGTVGAALGYENVPMAVEIDGAPWHEGPTLIAAIANGRYLGGGMHIAPEASFSDGLLDVICVGDLSRSKFLSLFPRVYKGAHLGLDAVRASRGRSVSVRALRGDKPLLVDVDGETPGYLPLSARIFPGALQLCGD